MRPLNKEMMEHAKGGLNWEGNRESTNVIDLQGTDMGGWIDANYTCWMPGTSSAVMYPGGADGFSSGANSGR